MSLIHGDAERNKSTYHKEKIQIKSCLETFVSWSAHCLLTLLRNHFLFLLFCEAVVML